MQVSSHDIAEILLQNNFTIACAESCTGGLLTSILTDVSGSSAYLKGAIVAYSNDVKQLLLGVQEITLLENGAVSATTAMEMAQGIRKKLEVDIGVAITGIAGPTGGSVNKPVGLVFIAVSGAEGTISASFNFRGSRGFIKEQSVNSALNMIYKYVNCQGDVLINDNK